MAPDSSGSRRACTLRALGQLAEAEEAERRMNELGS
jgi:hypothetical protein